jgi:RNA polymerase sigma factor (sigma-70 family)
LSATDESRAFRVVEYYGSIGRVVVEKDSPAPKNLQCVWTAGIGGETSPSSATASAPPPRPAKASPAEQLYEEYGERISRYCLTRLRSREDAEDAAQNTFLRVHQALRKGQTPRCEEAWLYRIARNVCLSRAAATRRRAVVELTQEAERIESELPAREYRGDELFGLTDALAELPANLRTAILLREWQGLSHVKIARAMDTTVSAVETLIVRARKRLAAALDRSGAAAAPLVGFAGRLQTALFATGPAKLLAGGALLLAAGGAGLGTAVIATPVTTPHPSSPTLAGPSAVQTQPASRPRVPHSRPRTPARPHVGSAPRLATVPAPRATHAPAADPSSAQAPTTSPPQAVTAASKDAAARETVPDVPTPTVSLPPATVPAVPTEATLPSPSLPAVTVPLPSTTATVAVTISIPTG